MLLVPAHVSATSQGPLAGRQTALVSAKASGGQVGLVPSQISATSQGPAAARHSVPAGAGPADTHTGLPPEQSIMPRWQGLPESQGVPLTQPPSTAPASPETPASSSGSGLHPSWGSQNMPEAHPLLPGTARQAPRIGSQRAAAQAAAGAGQSAAVEHAGVPQADGL